MEPDRPGEGLTYARYLQLDRILDAQAPRSGEHDELLFIVIHQTMELWMKLCLHELEGARRQVREDELEPAFKMLSRVARAQAQMIQSWEVLATMTPFDYARFRDALGTSSGFQSPQYRLFEFLLGAKNGAHLANLRDDAWAEPLRRALEAPSLYDETLRLLARRGFAVPAERLERDWTQTYEPHPEVEAAWLSIYRDAEAHWDLYELGEKLVDVEYRFQQWRFAHLKTVERIIGFKPGTGGTPGAAYLKGVLERGFFPELMTLRSRI